MHVLLDLVFFHFLSHSDASRDAFWVFFRAGATAVLYCTHLLRRTHTKNVRIFCVPSSVTFSSGVCPSVRLPESRWVRQNPRFEQLCHKKANREVRTHMMYSTAKATI